MANRTFKQYGAGYDSAGSLNVVLTIGGSEVYNGAVTVSSTDVFGTGLTESELFSFELDETVTGDVAWQMSVTGTDHTSKLWLGGLQCNLVKNNMTIDYQHWADLIADMTGDEASFAHTADEQADIASKIGQSRLDAQKAGLYDALIAGTTTVNADGYYVTLANEDMGGKSTSVYLECAKTLSNGTRDGEAYDITGDGTWPLIKSGSTLNMTVGLGVTDYVYNPPNTHPDDL